jgi:tRNA-dihydrouridine synthase C
VPEARAGWRTPSGCPVQLQLLGGDPEKLARTAERACRAGAPGVDLNFGCPAPTVNRHDGGATLLKSPERIRAIVEAVRAAVPAHLPVSAKLRLGWDRHDPIHVNTELAAEAGASWITIHGRTKVQGYRPPAHWEPIGEVRRRLAPLPIVANGDIWTIDDLRRCRDATGCEHFMLGRGALADPLLAARARRELRPHVDNPAEPSSLDWAAAIGRFAELCVATSGNPRYALCRAKQWLRLGSLQNASLWNEGVGRASTLGELCSELRVSA